MFSRGKGPKKPGKGKKAQLKKRPSTQDGMIQRSSEGKREKKKRTPTLRAAYVGARGKAEKNGSGLG